MMFELAPMLIGFVTTLGVPPAEAASLPAPPAAHAQTRTGGGECTPESQTRIVFLNLQRESQATVRGTFSASRDGAVALCAEIGLMRDDGTYQWIRVGVEQSAAGRMINFTINFRGSHVSLPANVKGKVVVRITSNAKGTFANVEKSQKD